MNDRSHLQVQLLTLRDFPSGVKFNHDKPFMRGIKDRHENPFMFHMCWTRNKTDKLRNFRKSSMWYLTDSATDELDSFYLGNHNLLTNIIIDKNNRQVKSWDEVGKHICRETL